MTTKNTESWDIPPEEWGWMPSGRPYQNKIRYVPFVDARVAMKHLDRIFGWDGWQSRYTEITDGLICTLRVWTGQEWIEKSDGSNFTEIQGTRGGISKALVRAAAHLGVGRNVYDCPEVRERYIEKNGRNFRPFDLSDEELVYQAKQLISEGIPGKSLEPDDHQESSGGGETQTEWAEFMRLFKALPKASQNLVKEWYSGRAKTEDSPKIDIVGTELFDELVARVREELDIPPEGPPL